MALSACPASRIQFVSDASMLPRQDNWRSSGWDEDWQSTPRYTDKGKGKSKDSAPNGKGKGKEEKGKSKGKGK